MNTLLVLLMLTVSITSSITTRIYLRRKHNKLNRMVKSGVTVDVVNETVISSVFDPDSVCIIVGGRAAGKTYRKMINETDEHFIERILKLKSEDLLNNNGKIPYTDNGVGPGYRSHFGSEAYKKAVEIVNRVSFNAKEREAGVDDSEELLEVLSFMKDQQEMLEIMTTKYSDTVNKYSDLVDKYSDLIDSKYKTDIPERPFMGKGKNKRSEG